MNAHVTAEQVQARAETLRVMDEFERRIMLDALDKTIVEASAEKQRSGTELDRIGEQIALLKQEENAALNRWNDAHVKEVRAHKRRLALIEQERR